MSYTTPLSPTEKKTIMLRDIEKKDFGEIAELVGRSRGYIREIYNRAKDKVQYHEQGAAEYWFYGLSARARRCLLNFGLKSKEEVVEALNKGRLNPGPKERGSRLGNYGFKTHTEVCEWAGVVPHNFEGKRVFDKELYTKRFWDRLRGCKYCNFLPEVEKKTSIRIYENGFIEQDNHSFYRLICPECPEKSHFATEWAGLKYAKEQWNNFHVK